MAITRLPAAWFATAIGNAIAVPTPPPTTTTVPTRSTSDGVPSGPDHVVECVADLELVDLRRGAADGLHHQPDPPLIGVALGDRERHPLAVGRHPHDDELPGPPVRRHTRHVHPEALHRRSEHLGGQDIEHAFIVRVPAPPDQGRSTPVHVGRPERLTIG